MCNVVQNKRTYDLLDAYFDERYLIDENMSLGLNVSAYSSWNLFYLT